MPRLSRIATRLSRLPAMDGFLPQTRSQRKRVGLAILLLGGILLLTAIVAATTSVFTDAGLTVWQSWEVAGVTAGIGAPLAIGGIFVFLPATRNERVLAATGVVISLFGVLLFWEAFPHQWYGDTPDHSLRVTLVYASGLFTALTALYFASSSADLSNPRTVFKPIQNQLDATTSPETTDDPTPDAPPQPTRPTQAADGSVGVMGGMNDLDVDDDRPDDGIILEEDTAGDDPETDMVDRYCGNCDHFAYRRTGGGLQPYCGLTDELMTDMEACDDWTPQTAEPPTGQPPQEADWDPDADHVPTDD